MILEVLENVRTLRGMGSKRRYRYTRKVELQCELCNESRIVNMTPKIKNQEKHPCRSCLVKSLGKNNKGKSSWNKGAKKKTSEIRVGSTFTNSSGYLEVYVGHAFDKKQRRDKYRLIHKLVAECKYGELQKHQRVHHIDGNKQNNHPENLHLCQSMAHHRDLHVNLESLSMQLVQAGVIRFNHKTETYYMPHLEEILNAYSVNSEEPCSLQINSLGGMAILSQADKVSEGATTIPLGSKTQESLKRGES